MNQKPKRTKIWLFLMIAPIPVLILTMILSAVIRFALADAGSSIKSFAATSSVIAQIGNGVEAARPPAAGACTGAGGIWIEGPNECIGNEASEDDLFGRRSILSNVLNLVSSLIGLVCVITIMLFPLWLIMYIRAKDYNSKLIYAQQQAQIQTQQGYPAQQMDNQQYAQQQQMQGATPQPQQPQHPGYAPHQPTQQQSQQPSAPQQQPQHPTTVPEQPIQQIQHKPFKFEPTREQQPQNPQDPNNNQML